MRLKRGEMNGKSHGKGGVSVREVERKRNTGYSAKETISGWEK